MMVEDGVRAVGGSEQEDDEDEVGKVVGSEQDDDE